MRRKPKHDITTIIPGHMRCIISEARGRFNRIWVLYMRNGGLFARIFTPPSNPRTEKQQAHRIRMACAVLCWEAMDDADRNTWNIMAAFQDRTGRNYFTSRFLKDDSVVERYAGLLESALLGNICTIAWQWWSLQHYMQRISGDIIIPAPESASRRRFVRKVPSGNRAAGPPCIRAPAETGYTNPSCPHRRIRFTLSA